MNRKLFPPLAVCVAAVLGIFLFLGSRGLNEPDEGRFAEAAREMSLQSSWLFPHLAGVPHLQKPPMTFWITAMCIKWFGVNEWAVRLPSAFAALGIIILTMHLAGLLFGPTIAWRAGMILLSSILFFVMARVITTDMLLSFWITAAIVAYIHYTKCGSILALVLFYICLGLGFLTKGPMAYLVPLSAVIPWVIVTRKEQKLPGGMWHWIPGILVTLILSASWFVVLFRHYPGLLEYYVQYEFIDRIASNTHDRAKPLWFYSLVMFGGLLPWSILLPRMIGDQWRQRGSRRTPAFWLLAGWLLIPWLVLHLVTSKLPTYILPLFPPMAILLAHEWDRLYVRGTIEVRSFAVIVAIATAALPLVFGQIGEHHAHQMLRQPFFVLSACLIGLGWIALFIKTATPSRASSPLIGLAVMMILTLVLVSSQIENVLQQMGKSLLPVIMDIKNAKNDHPKAQLVAGNMKKFGLDFYLQEPIIRSRNRAEATLPIPDNIKSLYVDDVYDHVRIHQQDEFIILISRYFLPDPMPDDWEIQNDYGKTLLVYRPGDRIRSASPHGR